jgi:protein TonB
MKTSILVALFGVLLVPTLLAQTGELEKRAGPKPLKPISVSQAVAEKLLIHRVDPVWKHHGMDARVSGTVVLKIAIGTKGHVVSCQVVSGPAMLQRPVIDAVRQWEYKPYLVNGKPVEFSTKILVTTSNY